MPPRPVSIAADTAGADKTGPGAGMAVQGMQAGFTQQLDKLNAFLTAQK